MPVRLDRVRLGGTVAAAALVLSGCAAGPGTAATPQTPKAAQAPQAGGTSPTPPPGAAVPPTAAADRAAPPTAAADGDLLTPSGDGDGDSWSDTTGREYRLGMVNTPEVGECFAAEATAERTALVAGGFRAQVYTSDRYGRAVAVVTTAAGVDVNVHLARHGFADDRYLEQFRAEEPALAARLDAAFAAARAEGRGLWSACSASHGAVEPASAQVTAERPAAGPCHPDYATCVPVRGDGSGRGGANDLDCGGVTGAVQLVRPGTDPYRLDGDGDGTACD